MIQPDSCSPTTANAAAPRSAMRRRLLLSGALGLGCAPLFAQGFPARPITLVVPFAPGGAADGTARRLAEAMGKYLNATVVVENRPSAGALVATTHVARAAKDGYTLLFSTTNALSLNPFIYRTLPYKPEDITPISMVSKQAFVLNSAVSAPFRTVPEFVAWAKAQSNGVQVGTTGVGTTTHILIEWIAQELGFKLNIVPYKGTGQSTIDLLAGRIQLQMDGIATAVQLHRAGKSRIVAAMGEERSILPDGVPNFREAGFPALVAYAEFGLMAPTGTPEPVLARLHAAVAAAVQQPEFKDRLAPNGEIAVASASPGEYARRIAAEKSRWERIVKPMQLQLD